DYYCCSFRSGSTFIF
nr:immunoglobulin light chain junction region [Macaca mulatta]